MDDPLYQFFPDAKEGTVDLYAVLSVASSASVDEIKKGYRKKALLHHPDKHDAKGQAAASVLFQQVGYAYAVLSDEGRRKRYDTTGRTDEGGLDAGECEGGWEAYFADLFEGVTRDRLDEDKRVYQGGEDERGDLVDAYGECDGDLGRMMERIPHSGVDDEERLVEVVEEMIKEGVVHRVKGWTKSTKGKAADKAREKRRREAGKEAGEAEERAKELGVWDEFYGSGKKGDEDTSALQAMILQNKKKGDSFLDGLANKYAPKASKRKRKDDDELDDAEFERIQKRMTRHK